MGFNRWFYLIGFFLILALPLLNMPPWFFPPDWGKTIVFRIILSVLLFAFLYGFLKSKEKPIVPKKAGLYLLSALLGVFFLATIFSLDTNFSLWGSPYRAGGFINFAFYIIFAVLAFFVLKKEDWPKIWNFSFIIGALVAVIAIFQWQGLFEDVLIPYTGRPPSTIGNPIMLALYLLLLSFLTLSFAIKENRLYKKILYSSAFALFIFVIFLTYSRAAYLGMAVGILYFFFFFPFKKRALSLALKTTLLAVFITGALGIYYINTAEELPEFIQENRTLRGAVNRLSVERALDDPRISGWKVSWQALKDRPVLGYGPENFSIGFDRHYDPSLPRIDRMHASWWDRAHNFALEVAVTAGIPALIIYLSLFILLFWQLQKRKDLVAHGVQATFLAYLTANFFSIDNFPTYLISFLLIGYALHIVNGTESLPEQSPIKDKSKKGRQPGKLRKYRIPITILLFVGLIWFVWSFNIRGLQVNSQINIAEHLANNKECSPALKVIEKVLPEKTFLDGYLRLQYIGVINKCIGEKEREEAWLLAKKATELSQENTEIMPHYTRNWLWLGRYNNMLAEKWQEAEASEGAQTALEKALQLSPKRQEVIKERIKTDLLLGQYQQAKERSKECIKLNESFADCWWTAGLSYIYLSDQEKADEYMETAREKRYRVKSKDSLADLSRAYIATENHEKLVGVYEESIKLDPENSQYYASLAFVYKELGQIEKARQTALQIIELFPEHKKEAEEFLKQLP